MVAEALGTVIEAYVQTTPSAPQFRGRPVVALSSFTSRDDLPLYVGVYNGGPRAGFGAMATQLSPHFRTVVFPTEFYREFSSELGWRYWLSAEPGTEALKASSLLGDDHSRFVLEQVVKFRGGDLQAMHNTLSPGPQYFIPEVLAALPKTVRWVDAGAYDGDTLGESMKYFKSTWATAFEPDPANLTKLQSRAAGLDFPLWVLPVGVSNQNGWVPFEANQGAGSAAVAGEGTMKIALARLDDVLPNQTVDFVKIDVEGADLDALRGAKALLNRGPTVVAIAAYHTASHLHETPELLHELLPRHRILMRSHGSNTFDTICYAIPPA